MPKQRASEREPVAKWQGRNLPAKHAQSSGSGPHKDQRKREGRKAKHKGARDAAV